MLELPFFLWVWGNELTALMAIIKRTEMDTILMEVFLEDKWRRGRDSNPGHRKPRATVFETAPFNRSGTSPGILYFILKKLYLKIISGGLLYFVIFFQSKSGVNINAICAFFKDIHIEI